jgi:hypothetical protein
MYLLLNWIKNKYFIYIISTITIYIIGLVAVNYISCIDYLMLLYICFIEFGNKNNIFSLSIITGFIADIFYSPIIGISLIVFFLIYIALIIYKNYVDFEKFYIRIIFYMTILLIYINYNLVLYNYPLDAFIVFNIKRVCFDMFMVLLVFIIVKRILRAF